MFSKSGVFALVATLSAGVHALTLNTPSNVQSGQNVTVTWTTTSGDQPFSLFLHHPTFNSDFAVANNVDPSKGSITFELPQVTPRDSQYTFRAVNITNIDQQYSATSNFAVSDPTGTGASGSGAGTATGGGAGTGSGTATATNPPPTGTGSASGTSSGGSRSTGASGTSSGAGANSTSNGNNGAISTGVSMGALGFAALGAFAML